MIAQHFTIFEKLRYTLPVIVFNSLERKDDPCKSDSQHFSLFEKLRDTIPVIVSKFISLDGVLCFFSPAKELMLHQKNTPPINFHFAYQKESDFGKTPGGVGVSNGYPHLPLEVTHPTSAGHFLKNTCSWGYIRCTFGVL